MITQQDRSGVYSSDGAAAAEQAVAVVAAGPADGADTVFRWTNYSRAMNDVGQCALSEMTRLALRNGAQVVYGIVADGDYAAAFELVESVERAGVVVCDSTQSAVQQALRAMVERCSAQHRERIAVVCGEDGETAEELVSRAALLNSERMVLVAPGGALCAAAVAGAIAAAVDPAMPLSGVQLSGIESVESAAVDGQLDTLAQGGVTALEMVAGMCCVVRGITTRTTTDGAADATWRELTTIRVVDEVVSGIRNSLLTRFARAKNTAQIRGAIHSQVVMELEDRVRREIIGGYDDVVVEAAADDAAACLVEFAFTAVHGLKRIWLSAHITV